MKKSIIYLRLIPIILLTALLSSCKKAIISPNDSYSEAQIESHYVEKTTPQLFDFGTAPNIEIKLVDRFGSQIGKMIIYNSSNFLDIRIIPLLPNLELLDAQFLAAEADHFPINAENGEPLFDKAPFTYVISSEIHEIDAQIDAKYPGKHAHIRIDLDDIPEEGIFSLAAHFKTNAPSASNGWDPNVYLWSEGVNFTGSSAMYNLYKKSK